MEQLTQEEILKSISAAFDSVNLINELNSLETLSIEEIERKKLNVEHLKIMLSKEWFSSNLTQEQSSSINDVIS